MRVLISGLDELSVEYLTRNGIVTEAETFESVEDLETWLLDSLFDAAVIDLDATGLGIYAARGLRRKKVQVPFIGISAGAPSGRAWGDHVAMFLENGGDYLLRGPANLRELVAALRSAARRTAGGLLDIVEFTQGTAKLKINRTTLSVTVDGMAADLTGRELQLLLVLASAPNRTFTKEAIMERMYAGGVDDEPEKKIVDVRICKIRSKLADLNADAERFIETVWGRGYRLTDEAEAPMAQAAS